MKKIKFEKSETVQYAIVHFDHSPVYGMNFTGPFETQEDAEWFIEADKKFPYPVIKRNNSIIVLGTAYRQIAKEGRRLKKDARKKEKAAKS